MFAVRQKLGVAIIAGFLLRSWNSSQCAARRRHLKQALGTGGNYDHIIPPPGCSIHRPDVTHSFRLTAADGYLPNFSVDCTEGDEPAIRRPEGSNPILGTIQCQNRVAR